MVALKASQVSAFLDRPDIEAGVFLAYGPDAGLVRETGQRLTKRFGDDLLTLDGDALDRDPGRLVLEAKSQSLFGGRRVVRVRGAGKSLVAPLAAAIDNLGDAAIILEAGNLTPRDPLRGLVDGARNGRSLPCYPDSDADLTRLISSSFSAAGIDVDAESTSLLHELLGNDREITRGELQKLILFAADSGKLARDDILTLSADNAALAVDAVADAAGTGRAADLEVALARALAAAVSPQQLLASAMMHFSSLRRLRAEVDAGRPASAVLESSRPKPHFSRMAGMERQLRLWSDAGLGVALERLRAATSASRKLYDLEEVTVRRALLAVCIMAAER